MMKPVQHSLIILMAIGVIASCAAIGARIQQPRLGFTLRPPNGSSER